MSPIVKSAWVASVYDEWNAGNLDYVCARLSPGGALSPQQHTSLSGMKRTLILLKTALPDLELVRSASCVQGSQVRDVILGSGTFTGEVLGRAPSGAPVVFTASCVWQFENGRIVQVEHSDLDNVLQELLRLASPVSDLNDLGL